MNWHHAYQLWHLSWLAGIAGTSILLSLACRRNWIPHVYIRALLFSVIVGGEIMRFFTDDVHWPDTLPLNLCNVPPLAAAFACLTLARGASDFVYFPGLTAAAMALLTPDLGGVWPARFFVSHGAII